MSTAPPLSRPAGTGTAPTPLAAALQSAVIDVAGMNCASCVTHVQKSAKDVPGVQDCQVNLASGRASVRFDPQQTDPRHIADAISRGGYDATPEQPGADKAQAEEHRLQHQAHEAQGRARCAVIGILLWLPLEATHWLMQLAGGHAHHPMAAQSTWMAWASLAASTIAIIYVGARFYASAWAALRHRTSNMDTLISMGATVAYGYSLTYFAGGLLNAWPPPTLHELYFMEATGLLALISLGHWLEARARQSAGSAIRQLLELTPDVALRLAPDQDDGAAVGSAPRTVPAGMVRGADPTFSLSHSPVTVSDLIVGDRLLIRPGDRVPIDGVVIEGQSNVDESMITGEPIPVTRAPGDAVIGGTINQDGRLIIRVTKTGSQTALAQIVSLVESAQSTKPPVQQLADAISAVFVPSVLGVALLTGIGWYFWAMHHDWPAAQTWAAIARSVCSVLIIACPCALGLAVPATVMVATGQGARRGILIRDINALQKAEKIQIVVFDKTGTVTQGKPVVCEILTAAGTTPDELLRLAASAEQFSSHPLAKAIVDRAKTGGVKMANPESFTSEAGAGVIATIDGATFLIGSESLMKTHGATPAQAAAFMVPASKGNTLVHVARKLPAGGVEWVGTLLIADPLKPDSAAAIAELRAMGLRVILLTGDNRAVAERIARQVGIEDVRAEVKPAEKAAVIRSLRNVAMVGDGINDAPALAAADLGIAIGGGSDIAKEAGDIVLVSGSLHGVAAAIRLSRATMRKMRQNLFLAFIYNVVAIPLAAMGLLSPLIAAGAMALSDVTVIGNALLLRRVKID